MRRGVGPLARVLAAVALVRLAGAQTMGQVREYPVPKHGKLSLGVPSSLKEFVKPLQDPASVLLRFRPETGDAFYVQVTSVWLDAEKLAKATPEAVKANVTSSATAPLQHAVEKELVVKELHGAETRGFYYSLTDRAPGPGEYKYMSQGIFVTGELMTVFTILHREAVCPEKETVLQMFAAAEYVK